MAKIRLDAGYQAKYPTGSISGQPNTGLPDVLSMSSFERFEGPFFNSLHVIYNHNS